MLQNLNTLGRMPKICLELIAEMPLHSVFQRVFESLPSWAEIVGAILALGGLALIARDKAVDRSIPKEKDEKSLIIIHDGRVEHVGDVVIITSEKQVDKGKRRVSTSKKRGAKKTAPFQK